MPYKHEAAVIEVLRRDRLNVVNVLVLFLQIIIDGVTIPEHVL